MNNSEDKFVFLPHLQSHICKVRRFSIFPLITLSLQKAVLQSVAAPRINMSGPSGTLSSQEHL